MKLIYTILISCFVFLLSNVSAFGVVAVHPSGEIETVSKEKAVELYNNLSPKQQRKLKKRMDRLNRKLLKKGNKKANAAALDRSILNDAKFRLGAVAFLAGIVLLLLGALFIGFGSLILWVGRLATLIGLILMVWSLIEHL